MGFFVLFMFSVKAEKLNIHYPLKEKKLTFTANWKAVNYFSISKLLVVYNI